MERLALFKISEVEMQYTECPVDAGQRVVDVPLLVAAKMGNSHVACLLGDLVRDSSVSPTGESRFISIPNQQQRSKKKRLDSNFQLCCVLKLVAEILRTAKLCTFPNIWQPLSLSLSLRVLNNLLTE